MTAQRTLAYAPPPLHGVWAMAPYLHDGSVPTLWHLLTPEARPKKFWIGGHALDLVNVGIAGHLVGDTWEYADGYVPWSEPKLFDSSQPGKSNAGHEAQVTGLLDDDKRALIEYLKTL
jgi:hypothetical protein